MGQANTSAVMQIFKKVYGTGKDLQPEDMDLQKLFPFDRGVMVGDAFQEAVVLTAETGITHAGSGIDAFTLQPAIAGAVRLTNVTPTVTVLSSVIPWASISRSQSDEASFYRATRHVVKNNIKSHSKFREHARFYGQSTEKLGYVSYATATYRGVAFTNGTGTLGSATSPTVLGATVAFTNGINAASKAILLAPGQYAAGIWVGMEGAVVKQIDVNGSVVAEGKLVTTDADYGFIVVDFTPVAASSTTSHRLCWDGWELNNEMLGAKAILQTNGTLFGISTSQYSLWRGNNVPLSQVLFTFPRLNTGVASAVNRGGLEEDLYVLVNPRTWGTLINTEAGRRMYDESYTPKEATNGFEAIVFHSQNGKCVIKSCRTVKEGDTFGLAQSDWLRSGSAEVGFTIPASGQGEVIFPLENQAGYGLRSYCDEYMFCHAPARSILWTGINDEAAS